MPSEGLMSGWEVQEKRKPSSPLSCEAFIRDDTKMLQRITVCWKLTTGKKGIERAFGQYKSNLH